MTTVLVSQAAGRVGVDFQPTSIPAGAASMKYRYYLAIFTPVLFILLATTPPPASAGVYTDDLSRCLVSRTTPAQKDILVNWIFSAMSRNPSVAPYVSIPDAKRKQFNIEMAGLFQSLMTVTCKQEMQLAVKYEGKEAIASGFNTLGQVAGRELFLSPAVAKEMSALDKYLDKDKLNAAMNSTK